MTDTLHTLNAARVIAEYVIVHYHISFLFPSSTGLLSRGVMSDNLMSFFFVLSGFVAMHSNRETDFVDYSNVFGYIYKRMCKTYPLYVLLFLADLPGTIIGRVTDCEYFWVSLVSQPLLLQCWLGIQHISISNGVGWYLCTLYWLWILFPFMHVSKMLSCRPWLKIGLLYAASISLWIALAPYNIVYTRAVPVFRLFEFLMGCGVAFTLDHKIHGFFALFGLALFIAYSASEPLLSAPSEPLYGNCTLWIQRHDQTVTPIIILSKFSIIWAILIHWLAATEISASERVSLLQHHFFKSMSMFSLHLYLSHYTVACLIKTISISINVFSCWDLDTMIFTCYFVAYGISRLQCHVTKQDNPTAQP